MGLYGAGLYGVGLYAAAVTVTSCEIAFATDPAVAPVWVDVSHWLQGFSIERGRQQELNRMEASTARILFDNVDRRFDPTNAASPYAPNVVPMRRVRLSVLWGGAHYQLFSGYVETWPPSYPGPLDSNVEVKATDGFKVLNLKNLNASYAAQLSGARISAVLDAVGWPSADRQIAAGDTTVQAATLVNVSALQHLQDVIDAENGLLFMNGAGKVVFVNRGARVLAPYTVSQATFGDGVGELLYADIDFDYSDVQLWNEVRITRQGGTEQVVTDVASQTRYYPRTLTKGGLLMATDADALGAAQWILSRFKTPSLRVERVELDGEADPANLWPQLFGRELGDRVTVRKTPPGGGARMEQIGHIEHVETAWSANGGVWNHAWQLSPADLQLYWILDDATQSVLDTSTVPSF